ncbi:hypothetical protein [Agrococcus beijingensis]|uniref:hypothetical protein n=1 Tax=Agrococcus beijingensis TaxID=3068634 RepID=UPI002740D7E3|nr:hypothetical protein [Agrococcus sp. REN33]
MARIHWTWPTAAVCLVAAVVTGALLLRTPPPSITVTDASGHERTIPWSDYPADPWIEPADVLAAPRAEEVEAVGPVLLAELTRAIDAQLPGLEWRSGAIGDTYRQYGNGYGGETLHQTYNSEGLSVDQVPADWPALVAALDAELAEQGYGPIEWEHDREPWPHETTAERDADVAATHGSLDPAEMWSWWGTAFDGSMWVSVSLHDIDRGPTGPADPSGLPPQQLSLFVGGTVIAAADEQAYRDGVAPFEGFERPDETHSS